MRKRKDGIKQHYHIGKKKKTPSVTITAKERKIFNHLSNPRIHKKEYGGGQDFEKGILESFTTFTDGTYDEIKLPEDDEISWHTHPDLLPSPPSPEDVQALLSNKRQQAEMIIRDGESFTLTKTPKTKALSKLPAKTLRDNLDKAFYLTIGKNWEKNYKKELEKMGFKVNINKNKNSSIKIPIKSV